MKALSPHVRDDIPSTIEVVGTTCFQPDHLIYDVQVMISLEGLEQDDIPLADLQDQYFRRITSLGIDKKEFKEDKLAYLALSYKKRGHCFYSILLQEKHSNKYYQLEPLHLAWFWCRYPLSFPPKQVRNLPQQP